MALVLEIKTDATQANKGIDSFKRKVKGAETQSVSSSKKLGSSFTNLSRLIKGGLVVSAGMAVKKFVEMASAADEVRNKFDVVFRGVDGAGKAIQEMSQKTGYATSSLNQFTSELGDLIKPAGYSADAAFKLSKRITELSLDLASFNNKRPGDVIRDFQSAFAGSSETLQKYGIDVRESSIAQEAFRLGLIKSAKAYSKLDPELKRQVRTQALISKAFKDSKDAIGDLSRTQDSYANQSRRLDENLKTLGENLGNSLIPLFNDVVKVVNTAIEAVNDFLNIHKRSAEDELKLRIETIKKVIEGEKEGIKLKKKRNEMSLAGAQDAEIEMKMFSQLHETMKNDIMSVLKDKLKTDEMSIENLEKLLEMDEKRLTLMKMQVAPQKAITKNIMSMSEILTNVPENSNIIANDFDKIDLLLRSVGIETENWSKQLVEAVNSSGKIEINTKKWYQSVDGIQGKYNGVLGILNEIKSLTEKPISKWNTWDFLKAGGSMFDIWSMGSKLLGFANGGEFTVGGSGGIDSQLVAFKATPGEQVSISPPGQSVTNNSSNITVNINAMDASGISDSTIRKIKDAIRDELKRGELGFA